MLADYDFTVAGEHLKINFLPVLGGNTTKTVDDHVQILRALRALRV